ncbi:rab-GTPase-TBC domain-containing protein [Aspergillus coremiiformis]|uniref:Rab-GTPase-TBC domain-containing protein n=1 Tax=Aspergillus coremiiformis TaxID=138285 RepID=A0A5N6Z663_9EURO|nr:rab-GTPase-TBC domain-containing protein [Aspergillus coremiiformis]
MDDRSDFQDKPESDSSETFFATAQNSASENASQDLERIQNEETAARLAEKEDAIRRACEMRDLDALVSYATLEGGFLRDDIRRLAWPILLQSDRDYELGAWEDLSPHVDEDQVQLDVNRSFVYYPNCADDELSSKKGELSYLIKQVLRHYPMLCYFQGYHDIVQVLLLVLGGQNAASAVARLSLFRIRDYMLPSLSPTVKHLQLIPAIMERADPALRRHLADIKPFFALAATLTLYAHDIQEYSDIARLFDFLLAREPVVSVYLFVAIILSRKRELLEIPEDEPEMLHFTLCKLPCPLDLEGLISSAVQLFNDYPPESLPFGAWKQISQTSVLKSTRDIFEKQNPEEAVDLFDTQVRILRYEEWKEKAVGFLWQHRRTIGTVAVTILVGAISVWMRQKGLDTTIWSYINRFKLAFQFRDLF